MSQIHIVGEVVLVCIDCGTVLHWIQEDKPWSEHHTLRVQPCKYCWERARAEDNQTSPLLGVSSSTD